MKIAVFAGSFDPLTKGHEDIVRRALPLFDQIVVAFGRNSTKNYFFPLEERLHLAKLTFADCPQVRVDTYQMLTALYCEQLGAKFLLRGIRNAADFDYENTIAQLNRLIGQGVETIFLNTAPQHSYISSTIVREIIKGGQDPSLFLPAPVADYLRPRFQSQNKV